LADRFIDVQLSSLPSLNREGLVALWRKIFDKDPPTRMHKELMVQFLAYRIQEQKYGPANDRNRRRLDHLAIAIENNSGSSSSKKFPIKPGTRLLREWKGQVHVVNVEDGLYEYRGTRYQSLSEIARLITGTRWSGPLFFGTKGIKNPMEAI
jgi:hypothetical protein